MKKRKNPFVNAFNGLKWFAQSQWNFRVHVLATLLALVLGYYLKLAPIEWLFICLAIGLVWITELLNTAIEFVLDKLHPQEDSLVGKAKDIAASAVLMAALLSVIIGLVIFAPKLVKLFKNL